MIRSKIAYDENRTYLTEITTDKVGINPVISDSAACEQCADMTPSELLQASLASCTNMTVRGLLIKRDIPYDEVYVDVDMEQTDRNTVIRRNIRIVSDAPKEQLEEVIERAKGSFVSRVLLGKIEIEDN